MLIVMIQTPEYQHIQENTVTTDCKTSSGISDAIAQDQQKSRQSLKLLIYHACSLASGIPPLSVAIDKRMISPSQSAEDGDYCC